MDIDPETLLPGRFVQSDDPAIQAFARAAKQGADEPRDIAVRLYYAVRDTIVYNPYVTLNRPESYSALEALQRGYGFCTPKAALLVACARAMEIPARIGFADVRNHLATPKLLGVIGSNVIPWHAYTEMFLAGRWTKSTPAFNLSMCEKFGVLPLEWDGCNDSLLHPYDAHTRQHMEYVRQHGTFNDVPFERICTALSLVNPKLMDDDPWGDGANFQVETTLCKAPNWEPNDAEDETPVSRLA